MVHWSVGPLVECRMLNVIKVKLLSERISGVPPVIFIAKIASSHVDHHKMMVMMKCADSVFRTEMMTDGRAGLNGL